MPVARNLRLGGRSQEVMGLLWRLGGLTVHQYARLASPPDEKAAETGRRGHEVMLANREASEDVEGGPGGEPGGEEDVA